LVQTAGNVTADRDQLLVRGRGSMGCIPPEQDIEGTVFAIA
jgi:hypothetical protein